MSGTGMKASDLTAMPLCRACHGAIHDFPTEMQVKWAFDTLDAAVADGAIKIVGEKD